MTRKQEKAQFDALMPVRYALKGWAFAADPSAYVAHARLRLQEVPEPHRAAGTTMIDEIDSAIREA